MYLLKVFRENERQGSETKSIKEANITTTIL